MGTGPECGRPGMSLLLAGVAVLSVSGCATAIHDRKDTIVPSKVALGTFQSVYVKPLANHAQENFSAKAEDLVSTELHKCIGQEFPGITNEDPGAALTIQPTIIEGKYVSGVQRVMLGASAGGSAVLLEMKFVANGEVIASPIFYSSISAWRSSMSYSFGGADEDAIARVADVACDYVHRNK